ncbi:MAG: O-antigen ligase family protein [Oceanospirillaceae bacterium]|nr:O-antigen ligase family protein [Oceanospirillaceae bacterium]
MISIQLLKSHLILLTILGFQIATSVTSIFGIEGVTLAYRAIVVFICFLIFFICAFQKVERATKVPYFFVSMLFIFILLYSSRIVWESEVLSVTRHSLDRYLEVFLFSAVIPGFAVFFGNLDRSSSFVKLGAFYSALAVSLMALAVYNDLGSFLITRSSFDELNPIVLGHGAVSSIILLACYIMHEKPKLSLRLLSISFIAAAFILVYVSGSRGPLVSLFLVLFISFSGVLKFTQNGIWARKSILIVMTLALIFAPIIFYTLDLGLSDFTALDRILSVGGGEDNSGNKRLEMWSRGLAVFNENPILGGALEDEHYKLYPHNIFIESFMSTGLFGGLLISSTLVYASFATSRFQSFCSICEPMKYLFIQYLVAAFFSGAIWTGSAIFVLLFSIIRLNRDRELVS